MALSEPVTLAGVKQFLGLTTTTDDARIQEVIYAVNDFLTDIKGPEAIASASSRIILGGTMLAARIWSRRLTPTGVQNFGDLTTVFVSRSDPDVALLLELGSYKRPMVG